MKKLLFIFGSFIFLTSCSSTTQTNTPLTPDEVAKRVRPAVVEIIVRGERDSVISVKNPAFNSPFTEPTFDRNKNEDIEEIGGGTGFFVSESGLIVTNAHVVVSGSAFLIQDREAKVVYRNKEKDLAILQLNGEVGDITVAELGDSEVLNTGQSVVIVGLNGYKAGSITQKDQRIVAGSINEPIEIKGLLETNISIQSGDSGSPLVDMNGKVVGMDTITSNEELSVSFVIPIDEIKRILTELDGVR